MTRRTTGRPCPTCDKWLDAVSEATLNGLVIGENAPAQPGDLTVCVYCGTYLQFGIGLTLGLAPPSELAALSPKEQAILRAIRDFARGKRH